MDVLLLGDTFLSGHAIIWFTILLEFYDPGVYRDNVGAKYEKDFSSGHL
jgi:hypothetical protein